jgi:hypothetical protein
VTLQPGGLFVLKGTTNVGMATITGSGVTLYLPAGSSINLNMVNSFTITPPSSGNYAGVSYYQVPGNSNVVNMNTNNTNVSGLIYAPSAQLNYNAAYGQYTLVVAAYGNFNSSTGEDFGNPPNGSTLLRNVVLAQ